MMEANACGYRIEGGALPLAEGVPEAEARELALYGGGDYELLFTYPADHPLPPEVHSFVIGKVIERREALLDNAIVEKRGYTHRW
jgi:thiamine-monophosphate kinase